MNPTILMYHSVSENEPADPYGVSRSKFQEQMSWLIDHGYRVISLPVLVDYLRKKSFQELQNTVVVTFDDGYRNFVTNAVPVLEQFRLHATVFIVTEMVGRTAEWSTYDRQAPLMNEAEVRYVKSLGLGLGSHTLTHPYLTTLNRDELKRELVESRAALIDLGEDFHSFAYPFGEYTAREVAAVKAAGYECALTVSGSINPAMVDVARLARLGIDSEMDFPSFKRRFPTPRPWREWIAGRIGLVRRRFRKRNRPRSTRELESNLPK